MRWNRVCGAIKGYLCQMNRSGDQNGIHEIYLALFHRLQHLAAICIRYFHSLKRHNPMLGQDRQLVAQAIGIRVML